MSFQSLADVFAYVQTCEDIPTSEVVTLLALAHHKNSKTGACFPSIATLRKTTKLSRRGQQRALRKLEQRGVLATEFHPDHRSSSYTLCLLELAPLPKQTSDIRTPQQGPPEKAKTRVQDIGRQEVARPVRPSWNPVDLVQQALKVITPQSSLWELMTLTRGNEVVGCVT